VFAAVPASDGFDEEAEDEDSVALAWSPEPDPVVVAASSPLGESAVPSDSPDGLDVPGATIARRSFFAQPDPLKWTAGAEMALRSGPLPQFGQCVGPGAWTPWTTSTRRPHAAQS
jgi:hypothetical protein